MMDGKHHTEIVKDIQSSDYDLIVMGALGIGRVRDSQIGSVCERVTNSVNRDVWVVKHLPNGETAVRDTILVGIDGSPQSFGALLTAIGLARRFGKKIELISVYDPYLHYSVFNGIVGVLTEKAAKVFRFEEQNQLHEEIIDTGLAQIYQSHLEVAERMAKDEGIDVAKTLLDGKCFQKVLDHVRKAKPWLLVVGRIGVHSPASETGLGSNADNLLRACPCDILLTTRLEVPQLDVKAEESIRWTPEAEERMKRVPPMVKGIARTGILRLAVEKGHSVITNAVIDDAMERFMPKYTSDATMALAESVALERAKSQPISMCVKCGITATESRPVKCGVCGGTVFEAITKEMIDKIAAVEGALTEETTYDGHKLKWTEEAKKALWTMKDAYQRRRTKARVEKSARLKKLPAITLEFAKRIIEEEVGTLPFSQNEDTELLPPTDSEKKLIARDAKNVPLVSTFGWTDEAAQRALRIPAGFMRNRTQDRIEAMAKERAATTIDLALVEEGIEYGKKLMAEMLASQAAATPHTGLNEVGTMSAMAAERAELKTEGS
jgi:nucleotide-binding universal stress UspA family protein